MSKKSKIKRLDYYLTFLLLRASSVAYRIRNRRPERNRSATPFSEDENTVRPDIRTAFDVLKMNFVTQFNSSSCSVASVATVLNAARSIVSAGVVQHQVTQSEILDRVTAVHWKERVSPEGHRGRRGLPLALLGIAVEKSLEMYRIPCREIDVVALHPELPDIEQRQAELRDRLIAFSESEDTFLIAHFNQGMLTADIHLPHISPVGTYDANTGNVLVMDVDPDQPGHYWVDFDLFFKAMAWDYHGILKKFGYEGGGYVWIRLEDGLSHRLRAPS